MMGETILIISMRRLEKAIKVNKCVAFFDFDNTISTVDVFDDMVKLFSDGKSWLEIEERWLRGEIGSLACLSAQLGLVQVTNEALDNYLARIKLDPFFKKLIRFFEQQGVKIVILSDNFDYALKRILKHNGLGYLKVYSNKLRVNKSKLSPSFPFKNNSCHVCAHCKKKNLLANVSPDSIIIYIGDGRSDICPAQYSDIVFAKDSLLKFYKENNLDCIPYKSLKDVHNHLKRSVFYERKANNQPA